MIFNTFQFLWLFPIIFLLYWGAVLLRRREHAPDPTGSWQADTLKLHYMRRLIADCRADGVRLIFVVSPHYWPLDRRRFLPVERLAAANGLPFLWHADHFLTDTTLFVDDAHLNAPGATAFTRLLVPTLRPHLP